MNIDGNFAEWFSGFVDAEGTFKTTRLLKSTVSLSFRIKLHKDDAEELCRVRNKLGIGSVKIYGNQVVFAVERSQQSCSVLIPRTHLQCVLQTPKILDFIDYFKAAIVIASGQHMDLYYKNYCAKLEFTPHQRCGFEFLFSLSY